MSEIALLDEEDDEEDGSGSDTFEGDVNVESLRPRWRTWIAPGNLTDPELISLLALFPSHITKGTPKTTRLPFVGPENARVDPVRALEEARVDGQTTGKGVLEGVGTGRMWKGERLRGEAWRGTWWQRVKCWFSRLFG